MSLERVAADGQRDPLVGTITEDPAVCLVDATITVSLQADGTFAYDWRHPFFDVSGSGTLQPTSPTTDVSPSSPATNRTLPTEERR